MARKPTRKGRRGENLRGRRLPGAGRKPGAENKVTKVTREFFQQFLDANANKVQSLFDRASKQSPMQALRLMTDFGEFCLPKLKSVENTNVIKKELKDLTDEEILTFLAERVAQRSKQGEAGGAVLPQTKH